MDPQVIQRTRYVLRTRFRRAQTCPRALFPSACEHLLIWLENHPVLSSLVKRLGSFSTESKKQIEKILADSRTAQGYYQPGFYTAASTEEHAALCLHVLRAITNTTAMQAHVADSVLRNLAEYLTGEDPGKLEETVKPLRDVAVDGIYEYLDEQIDTRNVIYSILLKYKQRSEWFYRSRLRAIADDGLEGVKGERGLAHDLQEYVFNQHVEFVVEPSSSSGEADLVLREPEGFLVSFMRTPKRIGLELDESDGLSFLKLGGKTIYYLAVRISDEPSASKSGKADEAIVSKEELVSPVTE
jgi:hypothetical protein